MTEAPILRSPYILTPRTHSHISPLQACLIAIIQPPHLKAEIEKFIYVSEEDRHWWNTPLGKEVKARHQFIGAEVYRRLIDQSFDQYVVPKKHKPRYLTKI